MAKAATGQDHYQVKAQSKKPPTFVTNHVDVTTFESGTVIVIETLDRLSSGFKTTKAFARNSQEHIGVIYRKLMPAIDIRVDGERVSPVDPLFLDPNARWYDETPIMAEPVEPISFELKGKDGKIGVVRIRGVSLPFNFHLKDPEGPVRPPNHNSRYAIMKDLNGIIVCRAGRQIDCVTQLPWMTFVNYDRFWKIEIDFDPVLDEYFGITTHKQQVVFSDSMLGHLENKGLKDLITDLRREAKKSRHKVKTDLQNREKNRASEEAMKEAQSKKPRPTPPSPQKRKKAEEQLEQEAKKQSEVTGESVETTKERIAEQAASEPYKVKFEAVPDGPVFRGERMAGQYKLVINTQHRFYDDVYEPARQVAGLCSKLEATMFVIAEAEIDAEAEQEAFYKAGRVILSQRLTDVLAVLDGVGESEDEKSAEMEEEETDG